MTIWKECIHGVDIGISDCGDCKKQDIPLPKRIRALIDYLEQDHIVGVLDVFNEQVEKLIADIEEVV